MSLRLMPLSSQKFGNSLTSKIVVKRKFITMFIALIARVDEVIE